MVIKNRAKPPASGKPSARRAPAAAAKRPEAAAPTASERLGDAAARHTPAVNPLIGTRLAYVGDAARTLLGTAVKGP